MLGLERGLPAVTTPHGTTGLNPAPQTPNPQPQTLNPPWHHWSSPLSSAPRVLPLLLCLPPSPPCFCRPFVFLPHSLSCSASVWLFRTDDGRDTTRHLGYIRDPSVPCESRPLCLLSIAALTTGAHVWAGPAGYEIDPKTHATGQLGVLAAHHSLPLSFAQAVVRLRTRDAVLGRASRRNSHRLTPRRLVSRQREGGR